MLQEATVALCHRLVYETCMGKAVSIPRGERLLLVWNQGKCRVYSSENQNLHMSVPMLDGVKMNYSLPLVMGPS